MAARSLLARLAWLLAWTAASGCVRTPETHAPLTTLREVAARPRRTADACPVALRGTVTYFDRDAGLLYLQDSTGAMAFDVGNLGASLVSGQDVLVSARFEPTALRLREPHVTVVGRANPDATLEPRCISAAALVSHAAEAGWVEVRGRVSGAARRGNSLVLDLREGDASFRAEVLGFHPLYMPLVGASVRLRGVSTARGHQRPERVDLVV